MNVLGVDGCRTGWVLFRLDLETENNTGARTSFEVAEDITGLMRNQQDGLECLGIDIPIGLQNGARSCDRQARALLGFPRSCSVFSAPCREVLNAKDYSEACEISQQHTRKKVSRQAWFISAKMKQIDQALPDGGASWILEVHPEVSFAAMNGGSAITESKKTRPGQAIRRKLLTRHFPNLESHLREARPSGVKIDDLLDAAAACWTAWRRVQGVAVALGTDERDTRNLPMRIWY